MKALRIALSALLAATLLLIPASPAAADVGNCGIWDNGTGTDVINTTTTSAVLGSNPNRLFGIRFKAEGTNPVFTGWKFKVPAVAREYSFYLHNWNGSLFNGSGQYIEHVQLTAGVYSVNLAAANYINLTSGNEYIASVYVFQNATEILLTVPIYYPSALPRMSAASGATWYDASGSSGWPNNLSWRNADPALANSWALSPVVCQTV